MTRHKYKASGWLMTERGACEVDRHATVNGIGSGTGTHSAFFTQVLSESIYLSKGMNSITSF